MLTHMFVEDPKSIGRLRVGGFKRSRGQNSAPTPNWNNCVILAGKSLRARSLRARSAKSTSHYGSRVQQYYGTVWKMALKIALSRFE